MQNHLISNITEMYNYIANQYLYMQITINERPWARSLIFALRASYHHSSQCTKQTKTAKRTTYSRRMPAVGEIYKYQQRDDDKELHDEKMNKYNEALPLYRKALKIRKAKLGDEHPDTKKVQKWVAEVASFTFSLARDRRLLLVYRQSFSSSGLLILFWIHFSPASYANYYG